MNNCYSLAKKTFPIAFRGQTKLINMVIRLLPTHLSLIYSVINKHPSNFPIGHLSISSRSLHTCCSVCPEILPSSSQPTLLKWYST